MSLIEDLFSKLNNLNKPLSYLELSGVMNAGNTQVRNSIRDMINRGVPIKKDRRYREFYISLSTKHTYDYFNSKHKALAKRVEKFIKSSCDLCGNDEIAAKFKITTKYSHDIVCYLSRTNGVEVVKARIDGKSYYTIGGTKYVKKEKGHFDNHCIDHLLFNGGAMEAVRLHKSISQLRG